MAVSKSNQGAYVDQNQGAWNESEAVAAGRTTKNTVSNPLGTAHGMILRQIHPQKQGQ